MTSSYLSGSHFWYGLVRSGRSRLLNFFFFFVLPRSPARGSLLHVLAFRAGVFGWHRVRYPSLNELVYILLSSYLGVVFASSTSLVPLPVLLHYIYLFSILGLFFFFFSCGGSRHIMLHTDFHLDS